MEKEKKQNFFCDKTKHYSLILHHKSHKDIARKHLSIKIQGGKEKKTKILLQQCICDELHEDIFLEISSCQVPNHSLYEIAVILCACPSLKELDFSCNGLGDLGIQLLVSSLEHPDSHLELLIL